MRTRAPLALLAAIGLLGCGGDAVLPGGGAPGPTDDDDAADDDDDDATDDDDDVTDDDDADPGDFDGMLAYFTLQGTIHHPQGRASQAYGYFLKEAAAVGRGDDYGCDVSLPDDDEGRGEDWISLDAGPWAAFSGTVNNEPWEYGLDQEFNDGFLVYFGSNTGNPPALPPGMLLDFEVPGGDELPPIYMPNAMPTHAAFNVDEPALEPGQEMLFVSSEEGLHFEWPPLGEMGVEIVLAFFSDDGSQWVVDCWVEDDGSFWVEPQLLVDMPRGVNGLSWLRRYTDLFHPETKEHPDTFMQGTLQHRWFVQMVDATDG